MTAQAVDNVCVAYLYLYAAIVAVGGTYDAWLTITGRPMVTDHLRNYGAVHPWFVLASCIFVAWTSGLFASAFAVHIWVRQ